MSALLSLRRRIGQSALRLRYLGRARYCPVCQRHVRRFLAAGVVPRPDAVCPLCGSFERHRAMWLFLSERTDLFAARGRRVLHIAPERFLRVRLQQQLGTGYLPVDLLNPEVQRMDITDIREPDGSFDAILCSHVLEHIPDDRRAIRELYRVLAPGGWALVLVPIGGETTHEDPLITDLQERLRLFGQEDHVRLYGRDVEARLREAGFAVEPVDVLALAGPERTRKMALKPDPGFFFCTRRSSP